MRFHSKLKRFSALRQAYAAGRSARLNAGAAIALPSQKSSPPTKIIISETAAAQQTR
jgi:hypothetical protein